MQEELASTFMESEWGAAFRRDRDLGGPVPVVAQGPAPETATALLRIGKWGASVLDVAAALHGPDAFVAITIDARTLVAWALPEGIVVGETSPQGPGRILNRRAQQRRQRELGHARV
jgi:hypothetical protein